MINVDIISGFLGSGKTTFANKLLRHYMDGGLRPVFIVNEFGQTALDAQIIRADGFEAVEIEGGCICCSLKDDVAASIVKVIDAFSPTNIVFEPSGIFIFDNFFDIWKQPDISAQCLPPHILTVVDSLAFSAAKAVYGSFIYNQIKNAGIILLSKLEKTPCNVDELICDIKNINNSAFIVSKIWNEWDSGDFERINVSHNAPHTLHNSHHHNKLQSYTIVPAAPFSQETFDQFIACCQSGAFGDLCRVKGAVLIEKQLTLLNIAMQDIVLQKCAGMPNHSLTFIGQTLKETEIAHFFSGLHNSTAAQNDIAVI